MQENIIEQESLDYQKNYYQEGQDKKQKALLFKQTVKSCNEDLIKSYNEQQKILAQKQKVLLLKEKIIQQRFKQQNSKKLTFDSFKKPHLQLRIHDQVLFDEQKEIYVNLGSKYIDLEKRNSLIFPDKMFKKEPFFIKTITNRNLFGDTPIQRYNKNLQPIILKRINTAQELQRLEIESKLRKEDGCWKKKHLESQRTLLFFPINPHLQLLDNEVKSVFFESLKRNQQ